MSRRGRSGRLPRPLFALSIKLAPVPCVDLLPVRSNAGSIEAGLIRRHNADGALGWNLVGGGIHRTESVGEAASRHLRETLGPGVTWEEPDYSRPETIGEYLPFHRPGMAYDPRKHAIALTYLVALGGEIAPAGEALDFRWFRQLDLPLESMGFGQDLVLRRILPLDAKVDQARL
jgi:ADP-ribose pyrophosphatase YjhB (NUDIX family)